MASFVRAFLKDKFDQRDYKEAQYDYFCVQKGYDSRRVAGLVWGDETFPEKPGNLRKGMVNEKEWEAGLEEARKEMGNEIVDLAEKEFAAEKEEEEADKKEREIAGKALEGEESTCYSRLNPGMKSNQVDFLLPRLVKCNDEKHILVHPKDAQAAKDAGLEALYIRIDGEEENQAAKGPIVALKKFSSGDEPEFWWKPPAKMWHAKMTPFAKYNRQGLWKGDRIWQPWTAELHEDPDEDIKIAEEEFKKFKATLKGPGSFSEREEPAAPEEEWLSEEKNPEMVKWISELDAQREQVVFVR